MLLRSRPSWVACVVVAALGIVFAGSGCEKKATSGGAVASTCDAYCSCMASSCTSYPFAPDCVAACKAGVEGTTVKKWDLSCRAGACGRAQASKAAAENECPVASGQKTCS